MNVVSHSRQVGWSLPLAWILLFVAIGLVNFFGWTYLLYVAGAGVLLGVALSLFGHEDAGTSADWITFSFALEESIETVAEKLKQGFTLLGEEFGQDAERAWWEADNKYYVFKLSRERSEATYQLQVGSDSMELNDFEQQKLLQKLANVLDVEVITH